MTEDLIARLKAAHKAATPGPWEVRRHQSATAEGWCSREIVRVSDDRQSYTRLAELPMSPWHARTDGSLDLVALTRNALPEIIAALEERERMRAVVDVAQKRLKDLPSRYIEHGVEVYAHFCMDLRAALDALEEKG